MNAPGAEEFRDPSLVDFGTDPAGGGRRLELLGSVLVDRPLGGTGLPARRLPHWDDAAAVFHPAAAGGGTWSFPRAVPSPWLVTLPLAGGTIVLEVRPAPSGQLGVFLEQIEQWDWLARMTTPDAAMLSLFAHSGAASLAMAAAGGRVVHVDASRQAIALARRNAAASGLTHASIRWVCEDARTFVAREVRRGARYDGVVLDPPSWGHGPRGQRFAIDRDLMPLLGDLGRLLGETPSTPASGPVLVTCHSPRWHPRRLHDTLAERFPAPSRGRIESGPLTCRDGFGRSLELGTFARRPPG